LGWTVEVDASAEKALAKLGTAAGRRIVQGLREIASLDDPRARGKPLTGNRVGHWRYRFGDYRVIA
jgi:mRNA interferase RelE/StbE